MTATQNVQNTWASLFIFIILEVDHHYSHVTNEKQKQRERERAFLETPHLVSKGCFTYHRFYAQSLCVYIGQHFKVWHECLLSHLYQKGYFLPHLNICLEKKKHQLDFVQVCHSVTENSKRLNQRAEPF